MISVVVADPQPLSLLGIEVLLARADKFQVLAACGDGAAALHAVRALHPDVLLIDHHLPDADGFEIVRQMAAEHQSTKVVLLSPSPLAGHEAMEALRLGVRGILLKTMPSHLVVKCLRAVHAGEAWLERQSTSRALAAVIAREAAQAELEKTLRPREKEVIRLVGRGLSNKEIADKLCTTEGTVKGYMHKLYLKLQVRTRVELALFARAGQGTEIPTQ